MLPQHDTYSQYIYRLASWLRAMGWQVDLQGNLPDNIAGRMYWSEKRIAVNCCNAREALVTLAHEAGHVVGYNRRLPRAVERLAREREAYLCGWAVLQAIDCPLISKRFWRRMHIDLLEELGCHSLVSSLTKVRIEAGGLPTSTSPSI